MNSVIKIKKGDSVKIITGAKAGTTGIVEAIIPSSRKIFLTKLNLVKKSVKKSAKNPGGGFISKPAPIALSNIMLLCSICHKPTRIQIKRLEGKSYRWCKKCHSSMDNKT